MRRKDREITDINEMIKIMKKCDCCRLAMNDGEFPYIVPLNFGLDIQGNDIYLYFHSAKAGKKLDLLRKNPKVTFEMDCEHDIILYEELMSCTMGYASVMGHGIVEFVEEEKKLEALKILMRHFHSEDFQFSTKIMPATEVFRMKVIELTGKRRDNHKNQKLQKHIEMG